MRKLAIGLALASTALASPALARDDQWYVGVDGGAMIVEDLHIDVGTTTNGIKIDHEYGYDFGGVVGYDFGPFRLEAEASYREADPDVLTSTVRVPAQTSVAAGGYGLGSYDYVAGDVNALSFMVNGLLDFGPDDGLQGFVGGGVGVARVDLHSSINRVGPGIVDDSDTGFAWQALAGVRTPISDHWDMGLKYRFFNVNNVDLFDTGGRALSTRFRSHSLMGSLIYNFGGAPVVETVVETPPPPPYVAPPTPPVTYTPPPPPPPPTVVCNPANPYIVYFDWDKSNLTAGGMDTLNQAVAEYADCGSAKVMLAGYADRSGSATYNVGLSKRRNATVAAYLASKGVNNVTSEAFGETNNAVPTADGVREQKNRRVEVSYGPGSGY